MSKDSLIHSKQFMGSELFLGGSSHDDTMFEKGGNETHLRSESADSEESTNMINSLGKKAINDTDDTTVMIKEARGTIIGIMSGMGKSTISGKLTITDSKQFDDFEDPLNDSDN